MRDHSQIAGLTETFILALLVLYTPAALAYPLSKSSEQQPDAFVAQQRQALAKNPAGVTLSLRLLGDKREFKQGEIIRLELGFASALSDIYLLNTGTHDRSGRQEIETFHLDPLDGVVDPLRAEEMRDQRPGLPSAGGSSLEAQALIESALVGALCQATAWTLGAENMSTSDDLWTRSRFKDEAVCCCLAATARNASSTSTPSNSVNRVSTSTTSSAFGVCSRDASASSKPSSCESLSRALSSTIICSIMEI